MYINKPDGNKYSIAGQVAQLWQRDCASSIDDFKGWVNLRLNYRFKDYFSRHFDLTQFTLTYSILNHVNVYVLDEVSSGRSTSKSKLAHTHNWTVRA